MSSNGSGPGVQDAYRVPLIIDGEEINTNIQFDVFSPLLQRVLGTSSSASIAEAEKAVLAARDASKSWARSDPSLRRNILLRAAELMKERQDEMGEYVTNETGADKTWGPFNTAMTVEMLRDIAGRIAPSIEGSIPMPADHGQAAMVVKEPYGVVLAIAPWNAPLILGMRAVAYPIAVGNTTVLKGPELCPRTYHAFVKVLGDAGLPKGVVNLIFSRPQDAAEITTALIAHPAVKKINFTGSSAVGSIVAQTAGKHLKPVVMELGGKAPAIVRPDADLKTAAHACALGAFLHAGQICMSTERILVHSSVKQQFREALTAEMEAMWASQKEGSVLVSSAGAAKTMGLVSKALSAGASSVNGPPRFEGVARARMRPAIVENVTKDMDLYYQESFGPSVTLLTYERDEEALDIANDTEYGLSASIFTSDLARGFSMAKEIESGAVHINNMTVHDEPRLPHGGAKRSGFGRFGGSFGLDEFLRTKTITFRTSPVGESRDASSKGFL